MLPEGFVMVMETVCALGVVWWTLCRGRYMTHETRLVDRVALVLIGMGALFHALAPLQGLGVLGWSEFDDYKAALLYPGLALWFLAPLVRQRLGAA